MVGRLHVATLMKKMAIEAIYRRPNTSRPAPGHKIYPYLLRKLAVTRPNQVWATDITYIPMARGFVYLVAIVDWFSRRVLSWRLSITCTGFSHHSATVARILMIVADLLGQRPRPGECHAKPCIPQPSFRGSRYTPNSYGLRDVRVSLRRR